MVKKQEYDKLIQEKENIDEIQSFWSQRPNLDKLIQRDSTGLVVQQYPFSPAVLYGMVQHIDALRVILDTHRREMFRNGLKISEAYAYKCAKCGKEFKSKPENELGEDECDECQGKILNRPKPATRRFLVDLLKKPVNTNNQTLKEVAYIIEHDLDVKDDGYMLLLKDYDIGADGVIKSATIKEIMRGDPLQLFFVADNQGRIGFEDGNQNNSVGNGGSALSSVVLVCPRPDHRSKKLTGEECNVCGAKGVMAVMGVKSLYAVNRTSMFTDYYYIEGEVIWGSKFMPSLLYGYSPLYAVWMKAMALYYQDKYIMKYYDKQRSPRAIFAVATRSLQSFVKAWDQLKKWNEEDPEQVHPLAVETDKTGRSVVQFVDLMKSLDEMQYIEARNEARRTIGALWGVLPLFTGDLPNGWNNESPQIMVHNRAIKWAQSIMVEKFFDKLLQRMGIHDWRIEFEPSEEMDKLRSLQIEGQMLSNAQGYVNMGFNVWFSHTGDLMHDKMATSTMTGQQNIGLGQGSDKRPNAPVEEMGRFEGEPSLDRPSDVGGVAEGHPASGEGTSMSMKTLNKSFGTMDEVLMSLDQDADFNPQTVTKAIADMKIDASRQAWQFDYTDVGKPMEHEIRRVVQLMFTNNVPRNTAVDNLYRLGLPIGQAQLIVKTEFNLMLNRARELAYKQADPNGDRFKYYWDVHKDGKVCQVCYEIAKRSINGVSLEKLKSIIKDVATEYNVKASKRMWHAHPADRCVVKRLPEKKK